MIRLGVNIDHVATLRNARGGRHPDPLRAAQLAVASGADGITAHLREDRRHIKDADIHSLRQKLRVPLNFEMAATDEMVTLACSLKPHACCLVPERRQEVTTEGGLDVAGDAGFLSQAIARLKAVGIRVSLFVDPDPRQIDAAARVGAQVVELHTGAYANNPSDTERARLVSGATEAQSRGLELHAGHGLDYATAASIRDLPNLREFNIGHFIIGEAVFDGLAAVIARMRKAIALE